MRKHTIWAQAKAREARREVHLVTSITKYPLKNHGDTQITALPEIRDSPNSFHASLRSYESKLSVYTVNLQFVITSTKVSLDKHFIKAIVYLRNEPWTN